MGGGGVMRAAAKVAGMGVVSGGLRGAPAVSPAEHPVAAAAAARRATRPVAAIVSSSEEVNLNALTASQNNPIDSVSQRPCWELDDWEFAGGHEDTIVEAGERFPRLVFGGAPTLEEAKEATSDLKDALDEIYLSSSNSTGFKEVHHESVLSLIPKPEYSENKACIISDATTKTLPNNALKAFRLLNESPTAQTVVASIVSDQNVWHAVLQNEALVEFLQSQKSSKDDTLFAAPLSDTDSVINESVADEKFPIHQCTKVTHDSSDSEKLPDSGNGFMDFVEGVRAKVVKMMNRLSGYFQNLFGGPSSGKATAETDASAGTYFGDKAVTASLMGLAVMVIMVVVMKRG